MLIETAGRELPFAPAQIFDLVADIERYPDFLPWWISVSIIKRELDSCDVEQVLGRGPVRIQFASRAVLTRPERIDITSSDGPFRHLAICIRVVPGALTGCRLGFSAHVELRSFVLQQIVQRVLATSIDDILAAFAQRAHSLYGQPNS